jgi:hypothetical protein
VKFAKRTTGTESISLANLSEALDARKKPDKGIQDKTNLKPLPLVPEADRERVLERDKRVLAGILKLKHSKLKLGPGGRTVIYNGVRHDLGMHQAAIFKIIHNSWKRNEPGIHLDQIKDRCKFKFDKIEDYFKRHKLWKTLIVRVGRNTYSLSAKLK